LTSGAVAGVGLKFSPSNTKSSVKRLTGPHTTGSPHLNVFGAV
jgi:hypothetical protein